MKPLTKREIFFEALEMPTPESRDAYLQAACGQDVVLRRKVEELLKEHFSDDSLLAGSALEQERPGIAEAPASEAPAQMIGSYKLLEKLGEGGFGEVWMAEQREPVKRRVALKIIKLGMDSRQIVARFEAERQALAMMDHANIARIFDAGVTETGRPYFVMELVRGTKITEYCDQNQLPTSERLDLFIKVCHAIQHAHQKGIIHRDIKPSNILVTLHDGVPVPKVIDFGIAKATQGELTDKTVFTQFQQFIGTPAYISPEQAEMSGLDIDTRADIYSLGVLLYELLVGQTPFDAKDMMQGGLDALRQTIREKEPLRPSTKLNTLQGDARTTAGKRRQTELGKLVHELQGDLDWIVMKCLEKDRTRRYETANGLAADIQRHRNNEPIVAHPQSSAYRFQKLVRRNKFAFAAGAAVTGALVIGVFVSTWQAARAIRAKKEAEQAKISEVQQRQNATAARDKAQDQELRARRNLYVASMALAYQALQIGHLGSARELKQKAADAATLSRGTNLLPSGKVADLRGWEWRYLWSQTRGDDLFILGRHDPIAQVALWLPDGVRALSAGKDGLVKLWNVDERRLIKQLSFPDRVNGLALSPDGKRFVAGLRDGRVSLWDLSDFHSIWQVTLPHQIGHLTYSSDGEMIAIAGDHKVTVLWSRDGSLRRATDQGPGVYDWKRGLAFSPDLQWLAFGTWEGEVRLLNLKAGTVELLGKTEDQNTFTLAFSPDGRYLASGDLSVVAIWDWQARRLNRVFRSQQEVVCIAFSPDGSRMASANGDQTIKLWDTKNWAETATLRGHEFEIWSVSFSPDGKRLISSGKDDTIRVWRTEPVLKRVEITFRNYTPWLTSKDGTNSTLIAVNSETGEFISHRLFTGQKISEGKLELRLVTESSAAELMPNQLAAVGFQDGHLELFDLAAQRRVWSVTNHSRSVMGLSGSATSGRIAVEYEDGRIDLLGLRTGMAERSIQTVPLSKADRRFGLRTLGTLTMYGPSLALSQDGRRLFAAPSASMELPVWNLENGQVTRLRLNHREGLLAAAFSDDGEWIVTTSHDAFASLWEVESSRELARFSGGFAGFRQAAISPDKTRVVLYRYEGELSVWDPANEQSMATLPVEAGAWPFAAWDPNTDCIVAVTGSQLRLWRAPTWAEIEAAEKSEAEGKMEIKP
jgi:serine/threonine protein kinase/WD40 repeat protein